MTADIREEMEFDYSITNELLSAMYVFQEAVSNPGLSVLHCYWVFIAIIISKSLNITILHVYIVDLVTSVFTNANFTNSTEQ